MTDTGDSTVDATDLARHRRVLATTVELVGAIGPADRGRPTPCAGWDVTALVAHLTVQNHGFATAARHGTTAPGAWEPAPPGDDLAGPYAAAARDVVDAFAEPGLATRTVELAELGRSFPGPAVVRIHLVDCYVHAWDLARALGRPFPRDPDVAAAVLPVVRAVPDTPQARAAGAAFGPALPLAAGTDGTDDGLDPDEEVLRRLGRDPAWTPPPA